MNILITVDAKNATLFFAEIGQVACKRAAVRALNRTLITSRNHAAKLLQEDRALNLSAIKRQMSIERATTQRLNAKIIVKGGPISIRNFASLRFETIKGKRTGITGITYKIRKNDRRKLLRRGNRKAFTNPAIGGGVTIFVRKGPRRLPIEKWPPVPGLPHSLVKAKIEQAIRARAVEYFAQRYAQEVRYEIMRKQAKHAR